MSNQYRDEHYIAYQYYVQEFMNRFDDEEFLDIVSNSADKWKKSDSCDSLVSYLCRYGWDDSIIMSMDEFMASVYHDPCFASLIVCNEPIWKVWKTEHDLNESVLSDIHQAVWHCVAKHPDYCYVPGHF